MPRLAQLILVAFAAIVLTACGKPEPAAPNANVATGPPVTRNAKFLAGGDIMLSRGVARVIDRAGDPLHPFSEFASVLKSTDFNFANFEAPVSGNDSRVGKGLVFNVRRADMAGMKTYNFKIVSLANNHALDQGEKGLFHTLDFLDGMGIGRAGAGRNLEEAWKPAIVESNGIRFGFIAAAYSSINDNGTTRNNFVARIDEPERLKAAVAEAKKVSDIVVVSMHAGVEYVLKPREPQIDFARRAIDLGADIVIGHHPHWIQTFEQYKGKFIFYSLGNFIFDQRQPGTTEGLTLIVHAEKTETPGVGSTAKIRRIELVPIVLEKMGVPRPATAAEKAKILARIEGRESYDLP